MNEWLPKNILKRDLLKSLRKELEGELYFDDLTRVLYATDASAYREVPIAVAYPRHSEDIKALVRFADAHLISLIPRTAGTSLAGQVVGNGIIVDVSRHLTRVLDVNIEERTARVEPGVIRDELNMMLKPHGLFFAPETSTSNRAMIGGMIGNNACGATSLWYGSTRERTRSVKSILSDGTEAAFGPLAPAEFDEKKRSQGIEGEGYRLLSGILSDAGNQRSILREFPKESVSRRNTGYPLDILLRMQPFNQAGSPLNLAKLICGSEGTLSIVTEAILELSPLPPAYRGLLCVHCRTLRESLLANLVVMPHRPYSVELIDHYILECTKANIEQNRNRFFVEGDPAAILVVEIVGDSYEEVRSKAKKIELDLSRAALGHHFPLVTGVDVQRVWALRKAGLGLLQNIPGDAKPVPVIEDTAVAPEDLPDYIEKFGKILASHNLASVHYGHVGAGELHLRPILDLKTKEGQRLFRVIAEEIAHLVKEFGGSLSGEHGDGRLRGEFISLMLGDRNYELLRRVKQAFDPKLIMNPGKIVDAPPMDQKLRYEGIKIGRAPETIFKFRKELGIIRAAEQCNGSGDCRKTSKSGGVMCPSYMATRNEKDTTRARANILREFLTHSEGNPFDHDEILEVLELCISCKGCKSECPSSVDMARLKAEAFQQYYDIHGTPLRARLVGEYARLMKIGAMVPRLTNLMLRNRALSLPIRKILGIADERILPEVQRESFRTWFKKREFQGKRVPAGVERRGKVYLFCDEFTEHSDVEIGKKTVELLEYLGYDIVLPEHKESGRTLLSKGLLRKAKALAEENVRALSKCVNDGSFLVGIEPSAILSIRDEYVDLMPDGLLPIAEKLAERSLTLEEFIAEEMGAGKITSDSFHEEKRRVWVHGHCHQKTLSSLQPTVKMLSLPANYEVQVIPSGCCGMAGFFGYEKEHYDVSMQIGELVLFPTIRALPEDAVVAAAGTSCRAQIFDGTGKKALHPAEVLWDALKKY